jgi:hypothetical protein
MEEGSSGFSIISGFRALSVLCGHSVFQNFLPAILFIYLYRTRVCVCVCAFIMREFLFNIYHIVFLNIVWNYIFIYGKSKWERKKKKREG